MLQSLGDNTEPERALPFLLPVSCIQTSSLFLMDASHLVQPLRDNCDGHYETMNSALKRMLLFNQAVSMTSSRQLEEGPACALTHRATSVTQPTRSSPGPVSCSAVTVLHVWYSVMRHNVEGIKYHYKEYWGFIYVYYAKRREGRNRKVAL